MDRKLNSAASGIAGILSSFLFLAITIAGLQTYASPDQKVAIHASAQNS